MELVERLCDRVAVMHQGRLIAEGPTGEVRGEGTLEDAFVRMIGAGRIGAGLDWLGGPGS
jgi:ABC-2 type transport system ATP-binding protein